MKRTARYVLRRVAFALVTLWAAVTADFFLPRVMGGNPAQYIASQTALGDPQVARLLAQQFGLGNPNPLYQYGQYLRQLLHGNLGVSYEYFPSHVASLLVHALPFTVGLVGIAVLASFAVGTYLGMVCAWKAGTRLDGWILGGSFYLHAVPYFWTAMLLVLLLAFDLHLFPLGHLLPVDAQRFGPGALAVRVLWHAVLPIVSLVVVSASGHILMMRNNMLQSLSEDYVTLARAKGLPARQVRWTYAARTALLPSFTGLMLSLGEVVGGAVLTEIVFSLPGVGQLIFQAILNHDYPVIQGAFLVLAVAVIAANLLADLVYPLLDPRAATA